MVVVGAPLAGARDGAMVFFVAVSGTIPKNFCSLVCYISSQPAGGQGHPPLRNPAFFHSTDGAATAAWWSKV